MVEDIDQELKILREENQLLKEKLKITLAKNKELEFDKLRLDTILGQMQIILWSNDGDGIFTSSEGLGLELLGVKPGQVVGLSVFDAYKDFPEILTAHKNALLGNDEYYEYEMDGIQHIEEGIAAEKVVFAAKIIPQLNDEGSVESCVGVAYNITSERETEKKLAASQTEYMGFYDNLPISVRVEDFSQVKKYLDNLEIPINVDFSTYLDDNRDIIRACAKLVKIIDVNQHTLKLYNAKDKDEILQDFSRLILDEILDDFKFQLIAINSNIYESIIETKQRKFNGDDMDLILNWSVPKQYQATYEKIYLTEHDVTLQKIAEREAYESNLRYRMLFNSSNLGVSFTTIEGNIIEVNVAFANILGYELDELPKINSAELYFKIADRQRMINNLLSVGEVNNFEVQLLTKKGDPIWANITTTLVKISEEQFIFGITTDINEKKRLESALIDTLTDLDQKVQDRTEELENRNKELYEFTYSVTHDLRAPLRAMQGFSTMLADDHQDSLNREAIELTMRINAAAVKMDKMIRDLLIHSQVLQKEIEITNIDLGVMIDDSIVVNRDIIEENNIEMEIQLPFRNVMGSKMIVEQIINNLIENAIKFIDKNKSPHIKILTDIQDNMIRLSVEDNGIGIEEQYFEKIFKIFERLHSEDEYAGTGIGLALVKSGIAKLEGNYGIESVFGEYSRFWIELPIGKYK